MKILKALKCSSILILLVLMPVAGCAENSARDKKGGPQGPPPEAIDACKGKKEGDIVTFAGRQGESLKATCMSRQGLLAAVPERKGPPPEAIEACKDKKEGDSVTFTGRLGESLKATCKTMQGPLVAVPEEHGRK